MYNIAIVEDDVEIRRSLSDFFASSTALSCVLAVDSIEKFLKFHRDFMEIKLILLDVMLQQQSSIYSIPHLLQREPEAEVIMFTIHDDSNTIFQALTYGATGYLLKEIDHESLENALLEVLEGKGALLSPAVAKKIIHHFQTPSGIISDIENDLTPKEHSVIKFLNEGRTYEEISGILGITINGVRYYVKSIYKKLNISSRGELYRKTTLYTSRREVLCIKNDKKGKTSYI